MYLERVQYIHTGIQAYSTWLCVFSTGTMMCIFSSGMYGVVEQEVTAMMLVEHIQK